MSCVDVTLPPHAAKPVKLVVAVALIDSDGRVLLAERPQGKEMAGLWEFPGGKVHRDETPELALVRELKEEIGITTSPGCLSPLSFVSHQYETFHLLMPLYACRVWQGTPEAHEGQKLAWVKPRDMNSYKLVPADYPLIQTLVDYL